MALEAGEPLKVETVQLEGPRAGEVLVEDQFLDEQLYPGVLEEACAKAGQPLTLRRHEGYDHGYYFISTFVDDHLRHHAEALGVVGSHALKGGR